MKTELVGYLSVDSGLMSLGDPCYQSGGRSAFTDWTEFCNKILEDNITKLQYNELAHEKDRHHTALVLSGFGGDGIYPVYITKNKSGRVTSVTIDFESEY